MPSIAVRGCSSARDSNQPGFIKGGKPCVRDTFRLLVNARGTRVREEMKRLVIIGSWSVLFSGSGSGSGIIDIAGYQARMIR